MRRDEVEVDVPMALEPLVMLRLVGHPRLRCRARRAADQPADRCRRHTVRHLQYEPCSLAQSVLRLRRARQAFQPGTLRFHQCDRGRFRDAFRHTSLNHDSRFRHSGYYVAAHDVQILVHDEARPDQAAVAEHERGQSDDPCHARLVGEHHLELGKVDLRLMVRRRRKADLGRTSRRKLVTAV
jgi:hypothetical protein